MKIDKLLEKVILSIRIPEEDFATIKKEAKETVSALKKKGLRAEIGGSLAKSTLIRKKNQDIDIFVRLDKKEMSLFEKKLLKTTLKFEVVHGSRDYFRIKKNNLCIEIIPLLKFKRTEEAENVTDFSLLHVKYILSKLAKNRELSNEIMLAKSFCYACNCYGAESYIGGFSGYALEVLVCHYKGFINFLKKIRKDRVIDPARKFKNEKEIYRELNQSKLQSPVILIDPTHKYRNVCAGLTKESFGRFLEHVKKFLNSPSENFFIKKEFNAKEFFERAKMKHLAGYLFEIKTNKQEGDIAGAKMKKFFNHLVSELSRKEQEVVSSEFVFDEAREARAYLALKPKEFIEIIGPKKIMDNAVKKFKKVRKKIYLSKGFVCAKEKVILKEIFKKQVFVAEEMGVGFDWKKIS